MHRLFVAIRPPEFIRDQLLDLMDGDDLRWQNEDQLHLTLRFIGEVERPQAEDIAAALLGLRFGPFELRLSGVGTFTARRSGALWAGVAPKEPLAALAAKIDRACVSAGLTPERRAYHPHITLARWKGKADLRHFAKAQAALTSESWPVTAFTLYESHLGRNRALYEAIEAFPASLP
jgi:2'-5' RNA ligase